MQKAIAITKIGTEKKRKPIEKAILPKPIIKSMLKN
jgi:hypothetical protein